MTDDSPYFESDQELEDVTQKIKNTEYSEAEGSKRKDFGLRFIENKDTLEFRDIKFSQKLVNAGNDVSLLFDLSMDSSEYSESEKDNGFFRLDRFLERLIGLHTRVARGQLQAVTFAKIFIADCSTILVMSATPEVYGTLNKKIMSMRLSEVLKS